MFEKLITKIFKYNCEWEIINSKKLLKGSIINKDTLNYKTNNISKLTKNSKRNISPGWYLFVFKYSSNDVNLNLKISCKDNDSTFSYLKKISPERKQFRIIRLARESRLNFTIGELTEPLRIQYLEIFKIPSFLIFFILRKLLKLNPLFINPFIRITKLWKNYNLKQSENFINNFENYSSWIKNIEPKLLKKIFTYTNSKYHFIVKDHKNFSLVENSEYVLCFNAKHTELYSWTKDAIAFTLNLRKDSFILYGNEDEKNNKNQRINPIFKTDWNEELFCSDPFYSSLWIISGRIWNESIKQLESSEIELNHKSILFNAINILKINNVQSPVLHIPLILSAKKFHFNNKFKKEELIFHSNALERYLKLRYKLNSFSIKNKGLGLKIEWPSYKEDKLSIIIPTKDNQKILQSCINSISNHSSLQNYEIILVNNNSKESTTLSFFKKFLKESTSSRIHKLLNFNEVFNYSKINNFAIRHAQGSVILLLNNDIEFLDKGWDIELINHALREDIGFVGAKLIYPNHTIQHAGILLGGDKVAYHPYRKVPEKKLINNKQVQLAQEFSAVTGACMAITKEKWELLKGMDENKLKICFNDVDICLKAKSFGLRNIYLPYIRAIHHESKSRGRPTGKQYKQIIREQKILKKRWLEIIKNDPYTVRYNHLSLNNLKNNKIHLKNHY